MYKCIEISAPAHGAEPFVAAPLAAASLGAALAHCFGHRGHKHRYFAVALILCHIISKIYFDALAD